MTTHADLQRHAEALSKERDALAELLRTMQREMDVIKDGAMPAARAAARRVAAADNKLRAAITANASLFDKPRTQVVAGLKYGMPDLRDYFGADVRWLKHYGFSPYLLSGLAQGIG